MDLPPACPHCTTTGRAYQLSSRPVPRLETPALQQQFAKPRSPLLLATGWFLFVAFSLALVIQSVFAPPVLISFGIGGTVGLGWAALIWLGTFMRRYLWGLLWYCPSCSVVFLPEEQRWAQPADWKALLRPSARRNDPETSG